MLPDVITGPKQANVLSSPDAVGYRMVI